MQISRIERFKEKMISLLGQEYQLLRVTYPYIRLYRPESDGRPINFDNKFNALIYQFNALQDNQALFLTFSRVVSESEEEQADWPQVSQKSTIEGIIAPYQHLQRDTILGPMNAQVESNLVILRRMKAIDAEQISTVQKITKQVFQAVQTANQWEHQEPLEQPIPEIVFQSQNQHYPILIQQLIEDHFVYHCQIWNETVGQHFDLFTLTFVDSTKIQAGGDSFLATAPTLIQNFIILDINLAKLITWLSRAKHIAECNQSPWTEAEQINFWKRGIDPW